MSSDKQNLTRENFEMTKKGVVDQQRVRKKNTNSGLHGTKYINESIIQHR